LRSFYLVSSNIRFAIPTFLIILTAITAAAQSSPPTQSATPNTSGAAAVQPDSQPNTTLQASVTSVKVATSEDQQATPALRRIERARALAAAHQLQQAAADLENVRVTVTDTTLRNVTSLMLIGIYLEEGNYGRAQALLEEGFQGRASQKSESLRTYFAMAGQTINGVRSHLARYRTFGINVTDSGLPTEANTDLERVRNLLERIVAQAKEISGEAGRSYDAVALQEDVVGIRLSLARDTNDRDKWQAEYINVREKLALSQAQTSSIGRSTLLDAVTAKIPNPFASKPASSGDTNSSSISTSDAAKSAGNPPVTQTSGLVSSTSSDGSEPKLISTGSLSGRETKRVTPVYPPTAKNTGVSGTVRVFAIIDETGKVWVTNSEGPTLLRKAAEDAARNWSFPPTLVSGRPARVAGYLDFDFKL
jgi:TonB family protein